MENENANKLLPAGANGSINSVQSEVETSNDEPSKNQSEVQSKENFRPVRSTRTRQKQVENVNVNNLPSAEESSASVSGVHSKCEASNDELPKRSTRTRQKNQVAKACTENVLTKESASPRVRKLAEEALSPACTSKSTSQFVGGYTGSPVKDRLKVYEEAVKQSAGLKSRLKPSLGKSRRKSSVAESLRKVSAARNISVHEAVSEVLADHGVVDHNKSTLNCSRAPAAKVVRPSRKVFASGGRGVSPATGPRSGNLTGSSHLMKSRSRLNISGKVTTPSNMVRGSSFLPAKRRGQH